MAIEVELGEVSGGEIHHLPIVAAYAHRIRLVETMNRLVPSEIRHPEPGHAPRCPLWTSPAVAYRRLL